MNKNIKIDLTAFAGAGKDKLVRKKRTTKEMPCYPD